MSNQPKVSTVVIVGGGTAGWITAALLSKVLGRLYDFILIESDQIGTIGVGEATIPPLLKLNEVLGIKESEFVAATQGTFKLGIEFENWKASGERYMHTFGKVGQDKPYCDFVSLWRRSLNQGAGRDLWDYSLNYQAAKHNKFTIIPPDQQRHAGSLDYAYHFDAGLYAKFLRQVAERNGVRRLEGKIESVKQDPASGFIESVVLAEGEVIAGDFFVDCSGMRSLLIGATMGVEFDSWADYLPCDRAITVQTENAGAPAPYTVSSAQVAGWQWRIPLQHRTGNGLVYSCHHLTDSDAKALLLKNLKGKPLGEPRVIPFKTGMRREQWKKNCVAIGLAGGFLEPLESTSIHFIQRAAFKLIDKFPRDGVKQADIDQFNQESTREFHNVRDFVIMHYHLTERTDSEFWQHCRSMNIPDSLRQKLEIFRTTGKVYKEQDVLFSPESWYQVMIGQGIMPKDYHPLADAMTEEELQVMLAETKRKIDQLIVLLPTHQQFISRYCPASSRS